jgi:hypothetical protein
MLIAFTKNGLSSVSSSGVRPWTCSRESAVCLCGLGRVLWCGDVALPGLYTAETNTRARKSTTSNLTSGESGIMEDALVLSLASLLGDLFPVSGSPFFGAALRSVLLSPSPPANSCWRHRIAAQLPFPFAPTRSHL